MAVSGIENAKKLIGAKLKSVASDNCDVALFFEDESGEGSVLLVCPTLTIARERTVAELSFEISTN